MHCNREIRSDLRRGLRWSKASGVDVEWRKWVWELLHLKPPQVMRWVWQVAHPPSQVKRKHWRRLCVDTLCIWWMQRASTPGPPHPEPCLLCQAVLTSRFLLRYYSLSFIVYTSPSLQAEGFCWFHNGLNVGLWNVLSYTKTTESAWLWSRQVWQFTEQTSLYIP